jgi:hypothetical protein
MGLLDMSMDVEIQHIKIIVVWKFDGIPLEMLSPIIVLPL